MCSSPHNLSDPVWESIPSPKKASIEHCNLGKKLPLNLRKFIYMFDGIFYAACDCKFTCVVDCKLINDCDGKMIVTYALFSRDADTALVTKREMWVSMIIKPD